MTTTAQRSHIVRGQRHRLCISDFQRMADAGIFREDDRIELIDGELIDMSPIGDEHAGVTMQLNHLFSRARLQGILVAVQSPLVLDEYNEPEPDLLLLRFRADYYKHGKPTPQDVLLVIEVADSSLSYDRTVKLPLYAAHRIPEVWIVNLRDRRVEIYRDPDDQAYRRVSIAYRQDVAAVMLLDGVQIQVAELL